MHEQEAPLKRSFSLDLRAHAKYEGTKDALVDIKSGSSITYGSLLGYAARIWILADNKGLKLGDTVLSLLPTAISQIGYLVGFASGGFSFAPIAADSSVASLEKALDILEPRLVLLPSFMSPAVVNAITGRGIPTQMVDAGKPFYALPENTADTLARGNSEKAVLYIRTSGTTGEPKFLAHAIDTLWSAACHFVKFNDQLDADDRFLNIFPADTMASLFNMALIPLAARGTAIIDGEFWWRATSARIWHDVQAYDISVLWVIPTLLQGLVEDAASPLGDFARAAAKNLNCVFVGMSSVHGVMKGQFEDIYGARVLENYAMSETTFVSSERAESKCGEFAERDNSGEILPWIDVSLQPAGLDNKAHYDEASELRPANDVGLNELLVKSPYLCLGYIRSGGSIEPVPLSDEGYFATSDLASLDDGCRLQLHGRLREVIKSSGELINLSEIEAIVKDRAGVVKCAAVGMPHETLGESYILFVVLNGQQSGEALADLEAWVHDYLPRRMWPNRIIDVDEMPLTDSGKVKKHLLLQEYQSGGMVHEAQMQEAQTK